VAHFNMFDEWLSMPTDPNPDAPRQALRMLDLLEHELATRFASFARMARSAQALRTMVSVPKSDEAYRIAVIHSFEGGHHLGGSLESVAAFARRGVAIVTLTHFFNKGAGAAGNSLPFFPDAAAPPAYQGLTGFGREAVGELEEHGIIVDVSHATSRTVHDILRCARKPLIATHSSVQALGDHPYSLEDEFVREISDRRGLIGVILMPYWLGNFAEESLAERYGGLDDVVRTVLHVIKTCGTHKRVAIGSDFAGYIPGPHDLTCLSDIHLLRDRLLREIGDAGVVDDVMADNAIDFLTVNWGVPPE
jgi:membrane dipeptidase